MLLVVHEMMFPLQFNLKFNLTTTLILNECEVSLSKFILITLAGIE